MTRSNASKAEKRKFEKDMIKSILDVCMEYGKEFDEICAEIIEGMNSILSKKGR